VPPDYFSADGQRWATPLFDWDALRFTGYEWWKDRLKRNLEWYDWVRLDHFRGFYDYWSIPVENETAKDGRWCRGPRDDFFEEVRRQFPNFPFIAEDLGDLHSEVVAFKKRWRMPGMAVLQFAFNGPKNPYLPHNLDSDTVLYTGTHDNDTSLGWYRQTSPGEQDYARRYLRVCGDRMGWDLIRAAYASVSRRVVVPLQDILGLGSEARINCPGISQGNWQWRCTRSDWDRIERESAVYLNELAQIFGRCDGSEVS
jgi:4-alpha-glucanotransferase